jgi:hypothetical protein
MDERSFQPAITPFEPTEPVVLEVRPRERLAVEFALLSKTGSRVDLGRERMTLFPEEESGLHRVTGDVTWLVNLVNGQPAPETLSGAQHYDRSVDQTGRPPEEPAPASPPDQPQAGRLPERLLYHSYQPPAFPKDGLARVGREWYQDEGSQTKGPSDKPAENAKYKVMGFALVDNVKTAIVRREGRVSLAVGNHRTSVSIRFRDDFYVSLKDGMVEYADMVLIYSGKDSTLKIRRRR